jgi:hypothetical protein
MANQTITLRIERSIVKKLDARRKKKPVPTSRNAHIVEILAEAVNNPKKNKPQLKETA